VRMWTVLGPRKNRSFAFDGMVRRVAFSHDGRYLIVGRDRPVEIGSQATLAFEDGRFVTVPCQTNLAEVSIVDLATGNAREAFSEYKELLGTTILALTSGPPGISTLRATVHLTSGRDGPDSVHCVACNPNCPIAVATCRSGHALLWDLTTGRAICPPIGIGGTAHTKASFSPDGRMLLTS